MIITEWDQFRALDLDRIKQAGAAGVLVASILHAQKISAGDLKQIAGR